MLRFYLFLAVFITANSLFSQRAHQIRFTVPTENRNTLPYNLTAVKDLRGGEDDRIGIVHTGLMNKPRLAYLDGGLEHGIFLITKPTMGNYGPEVPTAILNVFLLQIKETILSFEERRRIDAAATLTVQGPEGPRHYGPAKFSFSKACFDATDGHPEAIREAMHFITHQLGEAYLAGKTIPKSVPLFSPMPEAPLDGAYHTLLDFQLGQLDTSVTLLQDQIKELTVPADFPTLYRSTFNPPEDMRRREMKELFGYRVNGYDYVYVKGKYLGVGRSADGTIVAMLPRNLYSVVTNNQLWGYALGGVLGQAIATRNQGGNPNQLIPYRFDLNSGRFVPFEEDEKEQGR